MVRGTHAGHGEKRTAQGCSKENERKAQMERDEERSKWGESLLHWKLLWLLHASALGDLGEPVKHYCIYALPGPYL